MASIASTLSSVNSKVKASLLDQLTDPEVPHTEVAKAFASTGNETTEASIRRWRKANAKEMKELPAGAEVNPEAVAGEDKTQELRRANIRLQQQLAKEREKNQNLVEAVYDAAFSAASALVMDPVEEPVISSGDGSPEVAVAVLGDWQLGKWTPTYNSEVCEARIDLYGDKVIELVNIQRKDHAVDEVHVFILGDIIEGELIFPGQEFLIDSGLFRQIVTNGPRILGNFLRKMLANFKKVHVTAVIGNHGAIGGRARKNMDPETNGDRMLYSITQQLLADEKRLTWDIPMGQRQRNWYAVANIGAYSSLLLHGDQFRGHSGIPWYGLQKKVGGWALGAIEETYKDVDFGHYHQPTRVTLNKVTARCVGSPESHNDYAIEQLAAVGTPSQGLRFVHPGKGIVTAEYTVWLDEI